MAKYMMNKNVDHDGTLYAKDSEIKKGDKGFDELLHKGHVAEIKEEVVHEEKQEYKPAKPHKSSK